MKWLESFTFVMRSSITALREKVEDPERMLYQLICDMEEELEVIRRSVAAAIADEIQLGKQVESARVQADAWIVRAEAAMKRGDESGARSALDQKLRAEERIAALQQSYESQQKQVEKLQRSYRDLEDKTRQARHKRTLLVARLSRAESARRINQALDRAEGTSAFAEFSRLERRVDRAEAMSDAYDRLEGRDPEADDLAAQFDADQRRETLENEFDELKRRVAQPSEEATDNVETIA